MRIKFLTSRLLGQQLPPRDPHVESGLDLTRRALLSLLVTSTLGTYFESRVIAKGRKNDPRRSKLAPGDHLVFADGARVGEEIKPENIPSDSSPVMALPRDPHTNTVRNRNRLNRLILLRFDPEKLETTTRERSLDGLVCYSGICTHTGCDVSEWIKPTEQLVCPCHASFFDPKNRGRVLGGPAPKPLAILPLKVANGYLVASTPFIGRIGFKKK